MKISPSLEFVVSSQNKMEDRDPKAGVKNSYSVNLIDNKKKNQSDKDWTPISSVNMYLVDDISEGFEVGKKYKVTFEQID